MTQSTQEKLDSVKAALEYFESVIEIMAVEADCPPQSPSKGDLYLVKHPNGNLDAYGDFRGKENKYLFYDGNYWSELDVQAPITTLSELQADIASEEMVEKVATGIAESHNRGFEMQDEDFKKQYIMEAKAAIKTILGN